MLGQFGAVPLIRLKQRSCETLCVHDRADVLYSIVERFIGYRPHPPDQYYRLGAANPPEQAQYEGVVFSDGTVVVRWLTAHASHSIWSDFETFYRIHGHPEYGTVITWLDSREPSHSICPREDRQAQRRRVPDRSAPFAVAENCTRRA